MENYHEERRWSQMEVGGDHEGLHAMLDSAGFCHNNK